MNPSRDSVTAGKRALELFTDRHEAIGLFLAYLHECVPAASILFFYGDGGNGKSLLLRFLQRWCCKVVPAETWQYLKDLPGDELVEHIMRAEEAEAVIVPLASLDFQAGPVGFDNPQNMFSALWSLRQGLTHHGLQFPFFDLAYAWYMIHCRRLPVTELPTQLCLANDRGILGLGWPLTVLAKVASAATGGPWLAAVAELTASLWEAAERNPGGERILKLLGKRKLNAEKVQEIVGLETEADLRDLLPRFFAQDLNASMSAEEAPRRVVLFLDGYEALWGDPRPRTARPFERDAWVRNLLSSLDYGCGIVVAVAGRELPCWEHAVECPIGADRVRPSFVGPMAENDAKEYLEKTGVGDAAMRGWLVEYAEITPGKVHPFYLGLCADIVLHATAQGVSLTMDDFRSTPDLETKQRKLVDLLLKYADDEIRYAAYALAACRVFDREVYFRLGQKLHFQTTEPSFRIITSYSFVWQIGAPDNGRYRIHDLLRRVLGEHNEDVTRRAHEELELLQRERAEAGQTQALAEATYHANRLDWKRGVDEWRGLFSAALSQGDFRLCDALLEAEGELVIAGAADRGLVSGLLGQYYTRMARHQAAESRLLEALHHCDQALQTDQEDLPAHIGRGIAFANLGELQTQLSRYSDAIDSLKEAAGSFQDAIALDPSEASAYNNMGNVSRGIGVALERQARRREARRHYREAIGSYDQAVQRGHDQVAAYSNKGAALVNLGMLLLVESKHSGARTAFRRAVSACEKALRLNGDHLRAHLHRSVALSELGELLIRQSRYDEAETALEDSVLSVDEVLRRSPRNVDAHHQKGIALDSRGRLLADLSRDAEAEQILRSAVSAYDEYLLLVPTDSDALMNKGNTLRLLGRVLARQPGQLEAAEQALRNGIGCCDEALLLAPGDAQKHANRAFALRGLGQVLTQLHRYEEASDTLHMAAESCNEASWLAPGDVGAHHTRGCALLSLGELLRMDPHLQRQAAGAFLDAISALEETLALAPDHVEAFNDMACALANLAQILAGQPQYTHEAELCLRRGIRCLGSALQLAPDRADSLSNRGMALMLLGEWLERASSLEEALGAFREAESDLSHSLRIAPGNAKMEQLLGQARRRIRGLEAQE